MANLQCSLEQHLNDYKSYLLGHDISKDNIHFLLACMPKSGSTYLAAVLKNLPGFAQVPLVNGYGRREQELSINKLLLSQHINYVAQHHIRLSIVTANIIKKFHLKPVILTRDIFDAVVSFRDYTYKDPVNIAAPMAFIPIEIYQWDEDKFYHFIADMIIPWYFNFYASWYNVKGVVRIRYEEINADIHKVVLKILDYYKISFSDEDISNAIYQAQQSDTRKNKGVVGRGKELPSGVIEKILKISRYYENIDFKPIGIDLATSLEQV